MQVAEITRLREIAGHIGYEWAMMLGAAAADWHKSEILKPGNLPEQSPLRVVHLHARTELVWLHARVLYGFLFINPKLDDLTVRVFLDTRAKQEWNNRLVVGSRAEDLCPVLESQCVYEGDANKKLFHATATRLTNRVGLPAYTIPIEELRRAFAKCYSLMAAIEQKAFREGLDKEWDVASVALTSP